MHLNPGFVVIVVVCAIKSISPHEKSHPFLGLRTIIMNDFDQSGFNE